MKKITVTMLLIVTLVTFNSNIIYAVEMNDSIVKEENINNNTNEENENVKENYIEKKEMKVDIYDNRIKNEFKKIFELQNIKDINKLSNRITKEQMTQILKKSVKDINVIAEADKKNTSSNIWIEEKSRDLIKEFINNHSSYTYSINKNGYLECDRVLRKNEKLDLEVLQETEVDIAINNVMKEAKEIVIEISDIYYEFDEENNIISVKFDGEVMSKAYEYDGVRIILLNSKCYNKQNIDYNLPLSDDFIKTLDNIQYRVLTGEIILGEEMQNKSEGISPKFTDNGQVLGVAKSSQIVYHGPNNNGTYCTVGSISRNEPIAILGSEGDYYHILYEVTKTNNEKTGYVLKSNILKIGTVTDEIMTGGYRYALSGQDVQSRGLYSVAVSYGSISKNEGVTLLYDYYMNYDNDQYQVGFIEYWTGSGMKRGYIKMEYLSNPFSSTLIKADSKKTTYTGPNSSRFTAGTGAIGENEYVCALGYTGEYIFIEYNTNSGRKRAFCKKSDLGINDLTSLGVTHLPNLQMNQGYISSKKQDVSAGPGAPNSLCSYVGAIGEKESVYRQSTSGTNPYNQLGYTYIVYYAGSSLKGGFVPSSILTKGKNPAIPDPPSSIGKEGGFQNSYYWQSGLGGPINSYKIGNGNKRLYLVFAQHGFEDEGYGDGIELVNIAYDFMEYMYDNRNNSDIKNILSNWTIYVVPYLNRDGITSGSTENGPGRCNVKDEIDINRNWPTEIYESDLNKGRNYTGPTKLGTVEAQGLKTFLKKEDVKPVDGEKSILIDIHGWDCETIGDLNIGDYYYNQFKNDNETNFISHSGAHPFQKRKLEASKASGYLAQWAIEAGEIDKSIILELPSHNNRETGSRTISNRFNTATINLLLSE